MNSLEWRAVIGLGAVYALRMIGMFMILPVFALYARGLPGEITALQIGLAMGAYGLMQAVLQVPLGMASDRWGRKPMIVLGMLVFAAGGFIAGHSHDIHWIIAGRVVQGAGAVSSVVSALLADVTRVQVRTVAMAIVGVGMGLSFILAMVLGPVVSGWIGVDGIFTMTGVLALLAVPLVIWFVPPEPPVSTAPAGSFREVLLDPQLLRMDGGIFLLHACMTALFVAAPFAIEATLALPGAEHWKVYLPVLVASILPVFPLVRWAESRGQARPVLLGSIGLLSVSLALTGLLHGSGLGLLASLLLYFIAFNYLEGSLPSMISRMAPPQQKGAALGVYSTAQVLGGGVGAPLAGYVLGHWGITGVFCLAAVLPVLWLSFAVRLAPPPVADPQPLNSSH
ncbi:MFS transporter [Solimonas sp. K1W22B-7]|uniref:MFS transporter n=1 Tax=Solimonas sp. K1W22B-7 TaxID=2303331 RepID=UPI0013C3FDCD|nr:MFS transporter [Solimonas sp. K1W22B-7]